MVFDLIQAIGEASAQVNLLNESNRTAGGMMSIKWIAQAVSIRSFILLTAD